MSKRMSFPAMILFLTFGLALVAAAVVHDNKGGDKAMIERGKYLVKLGGCGDCHSPKTMTAQGPMEDAALLLSGHPASETITGAPAALFQDGWIASCNANMTAWAGPWGVSFAVNLTPDAKTGLGNWTEDQFVKAIRSGKHRGFGRPILPPMPWANLAGASDEDLKAMFAYLHSIPAVSNEVPAPIPPKQ